jgi:uncharacterized damage-inducible protein DinB
MAIPLLRRYPSQVFSRDQLSNLYRHMEWADARVWDAVPHHDPADERLRKWLVHIHVVQRAFLHIWTQRPVGEAFRSADQFASLAEVRGWARPYYREALEFVERLTDERLADPIELPWAAQLAQHLGRPPAAPTLGDTCFQVTSHSTYHRGQVNARLRELGAEPPLVDYIAWVWFGKPRPEWKA